MQKTGFIPVATFTMPENCRTNNYFIPREAAVKAFLDKHSGNKEVKAYVERGKYEIGLYSRYEQNYRYAFYVGKKYSK